jgi:hypothetical protein
MTTAALNVWWGVLAQVNQAKLREVNQAELRESFTCSTIQSKK